MTDETDEAVELDYDSILNFYKGEIEPYLGFLVDEYDFSLSRISSKKYPQFFEEFIYLIRLDVGIIIQIGLWCVDGISVGRPNPDGWYVTPLVRLDTLIRRRCRDRFVRRRRGKPLDLAYYAKILREEFPDLLEGDLSHLDDRPTT